MADLSGIGSLVGGAGGLLGTVLGSIGQNKANKTNLAIARETNQMNYQIAQEANQANYNLWLAQNRANLDFWNMQNAYNSASSQRARLEQAGLNPYLMMNGGSAGQAQALNAGQAPQSVVPTMQGAQVQNAYQTDSLSRGMELLSNQLYNFKMQKLAEEEKESQIEYQNTINTFLPAKLLNENKSTKYRAYTDELLYQFTKETQQDRIAEQKERAKIAHQDYLYRSAQVIAQNLSNEGQRIINKYMEPQLVANYMQTIAQIADTKASTATKYAQIRYITAQTLNMDINNKIAGELADYVIKSQKVMHNHNIKLYGDKFNGLSMADIQGLDAYTRYHLGKKEVTKPQVTSKQFGLGSGKINLGFNHNVVDSYDPQSGWSDNAAWWEFYHPNW